MLEDDLGVEEVADSSNISPGCVSVEDETGQRAKTESKMLDRAQNPGFEARRLQPVARASGATAKPTQPQCVESVSDPRSCTAEGLFAVGSDA